MRNFLYLSLIVTVLLSSCKNEAREKQLSQIDSLQNLVVQLQDKIKKSDTTEVHIIYQKVKSCTGVFKIYAIDIPKDPDFRNRFAEFTQLEKVYKRLLKSLKVTELEVKYSIKQLENLKSDIQNKSLKEPEKILEYIRDEKVALQKIIDKTELDLVNAANYKALYNKLSAEMEAYAENLKKKAPQK